jgi:hypothetical protein
MTSRKPVVHRATDFEQAHLHEFGPLPCTFAPHDEMPGEGATTATLELAGIGVLLKTSIFPKLG